MLLVHDAKKRYRDGGTAWQAVSRQDAWLPTGGCLLSEFVLTRFHANGVFTRLSAALQLLRSEILMAQISTILPATALPFPGHGGNSYQLPLRSCTCITQPCKHLREPPLVLPNHVTLRRFPLLNSVL